MNKFKQEYLRKVMKFQDKRVELTEKQRKFLEYAIKELKGRIDYLNLQWLVNRFHHQPAPHSEISRLNTKSYRVSNILKENSYDMSERTMLLQLRNYHLRNLDISN